MESIGKYRIDEKLGDGAMGSVYKAWDPDLNLYVAIKTIQHTRSENRELVERFKFEAQALAKLNHKNIIRIYNAAEVDGVHFIAMEYMNGGSLERIVSQRERLPLAKLVGYIVPVCHALQFAHRRKFFHRDIKPANIMLRIEDGEEVVKVVDFGIARLVDFSHTQTNFLIGAPAYMAPELLTASAKANEKTDIWALGVTLYELIAYQRPFRGNTIEELKQNIVYSRPKPLAQIVPDCPKDLASIVDKTLQKDPASRYQTVEDLLIDLEPIAKSLGTDFAANLVRRAKDLFEVGELASAKSMLDEARVYDATNTHARSLLREVEEEIGKKDLMPRIQELTRLGRNCLNSRKFAEGKSYAQEAIALDSRSGSAQRLLAEIQEAEAQAEDIAQKIDYARRCFSSGEVTEASRSIGEVLSHDPENSDAVALRAKIQSQRQEIERRKKLYQMVRTVDDLLVQGKYEDCLIVLEQAQAEFPENSEILRRRDTLLAEKSEQLRQYFLDKAKKCCEAHQLDQALQTLDEYLKEFPGDSAGLTLQADIQEEIDQAQMKELVGAEWEQLHQLKKEGMLQQALDVARLHALKFPNDEKLREFIRSLQAECAAGCAPPLSSNGGVVCELPPSSPEAPGPSFDATLIERVPSAFREDDSSESKIAAHSQARNLPPQAPDATRLIGVAPLFPPVHLVFTSSLDNFMVGRTVSIKEVPFLIGRAALHLAIPSDAALSREHAVIDWDGKIFTLADLDSTNGTYLNGTPVSNDRKEPLDVGATIRLSSSTVLTFASDRVAELPDLTGKIVDSRFRLVKLIRASTKAAVYEARDERLARSVAVKLLSPTLAEHHRGFLEQFNREAQTAAALQHSHICKVIDHGQTPLELTLGEVTPVNYLCMEMLEGGSLADKLAAQKQIDIEQVCGWLDPLSDAMNYMHSRGVIHSGLKPTSVVFDGNGSPYITDFALANTSKESCYAPILGAPDFLAPEQWDRLVPTHATDQYALAVLTYLMLTGSRPYESQSDPDIRRRNYARGHVLAHEQASRAGAPDLPPAVSEVLKRALSIKPEDRYPSVREFYLALRKSVSNPLPRRSGIPRVFISYRRSLSAGWAVLFARELNEKHKISAFVDTQRVDTAARVPAKILKAIQECDIFVCLLAKGTLRSAWVEEEIRLAWANNKPMIPVFQESFVPPEAASAPPHVGALMSYEAVYLLDRRNIHIDHTVAELAKIVNISISTNNNDATSGYKS